MAAFCVSCGCRVNSGDKLCFKCGPKVPETSLSGRGSTPEEENASSSSSTKSLSQFLVSEFSFKVSLFETQAVYKHKLKKHSAFLSYKLHHCIFHKGLKREVK